MKVVCTDAETQSHHAPAEEFGREGLIPYPECPRRYDVIQAALQSVGWTSFVAATDHDDGLLSAVHDADYIAFLRGAYTSWIAAGGVGDLVASVFSGSDGRAPTNTAAATGFYGFDTTPLTAGTWAATRAAAHAALTAADQVAAGDSTAYALCRPPGHHASRNRFGGYCYLNHAALAAQSLAATGSVAIVDIDYHHGNGTQDIFFARRDVLTISLHGHPGFAYPYFSGFANETGIGAGADFNLNIPLPENTTPAQYGVALERALKRITRFRPSYLLVAAGFDTAKGDPTGSWQHQRADFSRIGAVIGALGLPTLVVQEGGYRVRTLGQNARAFFEGLAAASAAQPRVASRVSRASRATTSVELDVRYVVRASDVESVRSLVAATGVFNSEEIGVAMELVQARLATGEACGYHFVFAELAGRLAGYACFGPVSGTEGRFDLYWIAVAPSAQRAGLGARLMSLAEAACVDLGAQRVYVETSSTAPYAATRSFYRAMGYRKVCEVADFYRDGDAKVILDKVLALSA